MNLACYQFYASSPTPSPSIPPYVLASVLGLVVLGFVLSGLALFALGSSSSSRPQPRA